MTRPRLTILLALTAAAPACTSVDSSNILTSGMYASIAASTDGSGTTRVTTTLYLEDPGTLDFIELEGGDQLIAYSPDGDSAIMTETQFLGITSYSATFDVDDAGSEFIVELSRTVDDGAPDSRAVLPDAFDILTEPGGSYSRANDDLVIDWDPVAGDDIDLSVSGTCIESYSTAIEGDPGTFTVAAGTFVKPMGSNVPDDCDLTVELTRSTPGTLDPGYGHGGTISGKQVRQIQVGSIP